MNNLDLLIPQPAPVMDTWTWATVEAGGVRLDGDTAPITASNIEWLCPVAPAGARVYVQMTGKRLIVHGRPGPTRVEALHPWAAPSPQGDGHIYYDTQANVLQVNINGQWRAAGNSVVVATDFARPGAPAEGTIAYVTTTGVTHIWANGAWRVIGTPPVADTGWLNITWTSGWSGTMKARKIGSLVHVKGLATRASGTSTTIGTMPAACRPVGDSINTFARNSGSGNVIAFAMNSAGAIVVGGGYTTAQQLSVDAVPPFLTD